MNALAFILCFGLFFPVAPDHGSIGADKWAHLGVGYIVADIASEACPGDMTGAIPFTHAYGRLGA